MPYARQYTKGEVRAIIDALCEGHKRRSSTTDHIGPAAHTLDKHWAVSMADLTLRVTRHIGKNNVYGQHAPRTASSFHSFDDVISAVYEALNSVLGQRELAKLDNGDDEVVIKFQTEFSFYRAQRQPDNLTILQERQLPGLNMASRANIVIRKHKSPIDDEKLWVQTVFPDEVAIP
ncbi:hypothetical protein [Agarivorans sp. 1_MG-2023]|uniref:hypothetical protein n=1 Tax=Agarivorans sp. 1_MG-2023 TaxID=3062634 RepID=UPI0026E368AB|nr:hypothetical protein [Agarivorans sp. 1_MG-2023]MDO6765203.1 hypothetical protein [Agarivorans sp. 1_MG-2023]